MAAPNIANPTTITGITSYYTITGNTSVSVLTNTASSGKVLKIESLNVANTTSVAVNCTVNYYTKSVTQGSAPSGGTAFAICSTVSIPANATLVVIEKTNSIYLEEDRCLAITSGNASGFLTATIGYEDIS